MKNYTFKVIPPSVGIPNRPDKTLFQEDNTACPGPCPSPLPTPISPAPYMKPPACPPYNHYPQYPQYPAQPGCPQYPVLPGYPQYPVLPQSPFRLAHAYVPWQYYNVVFSPAEALDKGTLFPELYQPQGFYGPCEGPEPCRLVYPCGGVPNGN